MPSAFDTDYADAALQALLAVHGTTATYTPVGGSPASLTGIAGPVRRERVDSFDGTREVQARDFTITTDATDPNYGGVASPTIHATVTIATELWDVEEITSGPGLAILRLVREPSAEHARPHFRRR